MMASAKARDPQTWNRYTYALNNPLRFIDPDGLEVPESCAKDPDCKIKLKINVIFDKGANKGQGLTDAQKQKFESEQLAKAKKDYGTSNINLDVTYTAGNMVEYKGQVMVLGDALRSDSLNIVASSYTPGGHIGESGVTDNGIAMTFLNVNDANKNNTWILSTNTTEHEIGEQLLHVGQKPSYFGNFFGDLRIDSHLMDQSRGTTQSAFREGTVPRRYAVPLNPEANKPKQ
jgi:uncharacterized protein RhaS with RHS repeats